MSLCLLRRKVGTESEKLQLNYFPDLEENFLKLDSNPIKLLKSKNNNCKHKKSNIVLMLYKQTKSGFRK